jgi:general stress protein 26
MNVNYNHLEQEVIKALEENKIWVLSTSENDIVTSRTMSIVNEGVNIYFQTNKCYIKSQQMKKNNNVALCYNNISIEGVAEEFGDWTEEKNYHLLELYKKNHQGSYDAYGNLEGQVVYKVVPKVIKLWKYIKDEPIREFLYVAEKRAESLEFGAEPNIHECK